MSVPDLMNCRIIGELTPWVMRAAHARVLCEMRVRAACARRVRCSCMCVRAACVERPSCARASCKEEPLALRVPYALGPSHTRT